MIKRVPVTSLRVGMYITDMNNDWVPHNTRNRRGFLRDDATIDKIRQLGVEYVYIDADRGLDCADAEPAWEVDLRSEALLEQAGELTPSQPRQRPLADELQVAAKVHGEAQTLVNHVMQDVKLGRAIDIAPFNEVAEELQASVLRNPNALSCLGRIRQKDRYLMEHSVNLSVLMSLYGRGMGHSADVLKQTIVGALLHDIGKILTPEHILHKPGRLTLDELDIMKKHARDSRDILLATQGIGELTVLTAAQHHERMDGSGYPEGLTGDEISIYGRMVAIADVYDALTADRVYHKGLTPTQGLKKLLEWSGSHLDPDLVRQFIRCIGIYPVGSLVLLESGRLGVVIETNDDDQRLPVVRLVYHTKFHLPIPTEVLDLAQVRNQDRIDRAVNPADYGIDIRKLMI